MNPFYSTAVWFVSKLPGGASDVMIAGASMLGIVTVLVGIFALAAAVAALVTNAEDAS